MQSLPHSTRAAAPLQQQQQRRAPRAARQQQIARAFFGRKAAVEEKEAAPAAKRGAAKPQKSGGRSKSVDKAAEYQKRQGALGRTLSAFDFAEARSRKDAELLYEAKYGQRGEDGKMTREQYQALRRRIGGTAKDYWKDWVDVKGDYVDKGYVARDGGATAASVPALPFLLATVVALFGATFYVVSQTS